MENTENKKMKVNGDYLTVVEMAGILGISTNTTKHRIHELGIKPLARDALYPISVLETLRNTPPKGRPKKTENKPAPGKKPPAKKKKAP
jgi:hypothetical protein